MQATLMYGPGDVRVEEVPDPTLREPTDAVVRVLGSGICEGDLVLAQWTPASEQGVRFGHEFFGVVEDIGSDVSGLSVGDLVKIAGEIAAGPSRAAPVTCPIPPAVTATVAS